MTGFEDLPKDLKEMIWNKLEKEELYKVRRTNKKWKGQIENARSLEIKQKYEECVEEMKKFADCRSFFRDEEFTIKLIERSEHTLGVYCPYGEVMGATQSTLGYIALPLYSCGDMRQKGILFTLPSLFFFMLLFPFLLSSLLICLFFESVRSLFWLLTCFYCVFSANCKFRNRKTAEGIYDPKYASPQFPPRGDLLKMLENNREARLRYFGSVEEEISCRMATNILLHAF